MTKLIFSEFCAVADDADVGLGPQHVKAFWWIMQALHGFISILKPRQHLTSAQLLNQLKQCVPRREKVGYCGTLDPMATGVLPVAFGKANKLIQYLPDTREYVATVRFGIVTSSDDITGTVLASTACPNITKDHVLDALPSFLGLIQQRPPVVSAVWVDGVRAYNRARMDASFQESQLAERPVIIDSIQLENWLPGEFPEAVVRVACRSGVYIRSLARDLGRQLGVGATLSNLDRTHSHGFFATESTPLASVPFVNFKEALIALDAPFARFPSVRLMSTPQAPRAPEFYFSHGNPTSCTLTDAATASAADQPAEIVRVYSADGAAFVGIGSFSSLSKHGRVKTLASVIPV